MRKAIMILIVGFHFVMIGAQGTKNFIDQPFVEVTGTAEIEVVPDEIYISIVIKEDDSKGKQQVEEQEKKMLKTLTDIGIDVNKDLSILDFSSDFKEYWYKKSGIRTAKKYQLIVNSGATLGKVFLEMEEIGISNLSIIKTDHSKIEELKQEVKVDAIKAAKDKATKLVEAIHQKVGKAIYIQERNVRPYGNQVVNYAFRAETGAAQMETPNLDFGKIMLEYEIFVRFILE
ncbi:MULTISPECIES: SIMPL domain-containing protein [unclassified Saccharicrinis]|uniref:SIMPL domain-containing protein n=1 Tax=unclassified Saccharicrinis TaxID=2646859 RepID=UPI003D33681B